MKTFIFVTDGGQGPTPEKCSTLAFLQNINVDLTGTNTSLYGATTLSITPNKK